MQRMSIRRSRGERSEAGESPVADARLRQHAPTTPLMRPYRPDSPSRTSRKSGPRMNPVARHPAGEEYGEREPPDGVDPWGFRMVVGVTCRHSWMPLATCCESRRATSKSTAEPNVSGTTTVAPATPSRFLHPSRLQQTFRLGPRLGSNRAERDPGGHDGDQSAPNSVAFRGLVRTCASGGHRGTLQAVSSHFAGSIPTKHRDRSTTEFCPSSVYRAPQQTDLRQ